MHRLNWAWRLVTASLAIGCARPGPPPGAAPDFAPPRLLSISPESVSVLPNFGDWVEFEFDEVVSEGTTPNFGNGNGELERLILLSPDTLVPDVKWRRTRIAVRPRNGWKPNTVYRVELIAGLRDLRQNETKDAAVVTFTTGDRAPTRFLSGSAVDWARRAFVPGALVEAILLPDSLGYRSAADSLGQFAIGPLPEGEYLVRVTADANTNRRADRNEGWDTVHVAATADSVGEVWTFSRDTLPPTLAQNSASRRDSFSIALRLSHPVDPSFRLESDSITILLLPDSTPVQTFTALPAAAHDSIYIPIDSMRRADAIRLADTAAASLDSVAADTTGQQIQDSIPETQPPVAAADTLDESTTDSVRSDRPSDDRPLLASIIVVRVGRAIVPGDRYLIRLRGVRAMGGATADSLTTQLILDPPVEADTTSATTPDSTAIPADTAVAIPVGEPPLDEPKR